MTRTRKAAAVATACALVSFASIALAGAQPAAAPEPAERPQAANPQAQPAAPQPGAPGPLVLEKLESGFVVAPDVKVTDIDGDVGTLVGGYAGWLADGALLVAGAGYWLADGPGDLEMAYGGVLVGWSIDAGSRIRFGARGLVGGGQASLSDTFSFRVPSFPFGRDMRAGAGSFHFPGDGEVVMRRVSFDQGFFIFEPQAVVTVRLLDRLGLDVGVGYRLIGAAGGVEDRLRGVTGSVAIRFGR